jgi:peptidoglycan hydrolase CwlO-like protein
LDQVITPPSQVEHDLYQLRSKLAQFEIILPKWYNEITKLKTENNQLKAEIAQIKAEIKEIRAKK